MSSLKRGVPRMPYDPLQEALDERDECALDLERARDAARLVRPFFRPPRNPRTRDGRCYQYAVQEIMAWRKAGAPDPAPDIVHGTIDREDVPLGHAWIERDGVAYDWQTFAVERGHPMTIGDFYRERGAVAIERYDVKTARERFLSSGHCGPWT